jgi:hypothetical protein
MSIQCGECKAACNETDAACKSCGCPLPKIVGGASTSEQGTVAPLVLGILSLVLWIIPLFGVPVSITGFVMSQRLCLRTNERLGKGPRAMSVIGFALSLLNAVIAFSYFIDHH